MPFAWAHKACTYAVVLCGFFSMVLSGVIFPLLALFALLGIFFSWRWESPRIDTKRYRLTWTLISVSMLVLSTASVFMGFAFLFAAAHLLLFLLVAQCFNRRTVRDFTSLSILAFLCLVAGTILNNDLSYGFFFFIFVIFATWTLILLHLRRETEQNMLLRQKTGEPIPVSVQRILNSRRVVTKSFFLGTALLSLSIFTLTAVIFLLIPRIGLGLIMNPSRDGANLAGFHDGVTLGDHGLIKLDKTIVMRVQVNKKYQGRMAPSLYWRGVAFDHYEGGRWSRSKNAPITHKVFVEDLRNEKHYLIHNQGTRRLSQLRIIEKTGLKQEIYLEPLGYDVLFGASKPMIFHLPRQLSRKRHIPSQNDELRYRHKAGIQYTVFSDPISKRSTVSKISRLSKTFHSSLSWTACAPGYEDRTCIPERVRQKALEITKNAATPYEKIVAIEAWLRINFSYTLEMKSPGEMEPIDFFLFERKKGHCEYFSSAMAVMGRMVGIPTRNVNGFAGGEWNEYDNYIAVRAGDAHSWVEAYFPDVGWVKFDPTPPGYSDLLGRGADGIRAKFQRFMDTLRFKWFKWVIEYDLYQQLSVFKQIKDLFGSSGSFLKGGFSGVKDWVHDHKERAIGAATVIGGLLVLLVIIRRQRFAFSIAAKKHQRKESIIGDLYHKTLRQLEKRGNVRVSSLTPLEHANVVASTDMPASTEFMLFTKIYYGAIYGEYENPKLQKLARVLAAKIESALKAERKAS